MFSSSRNLLRIFNHHSSLKINQIVLNNICTKNYCQQVPTIISSTQFTNAKGNIASDEDSNIEGSKVSDVATDIIDVSNFTLTSAEEIKIRKNDKDQQSSVLEPYEKDISHLKPILPATETFARYANHSESIQMLADLGVHLYRWEENDKIMNLIINLDKEELKKYILFFHETVGIPLEQLGQMFSKSPFVLGEKLENLQARIGYLKNKKFTDEAIAGIVSRNPKWLEYRVEQIDEQLGFFQQTFKLSGNQVREVCSQLPKVITNEKKWLMDVTFAVKEEMGFSPPEMKKMFLRHPRMWTQVASDLVKTFDYVHKEMGISHEQIAKVPQILTTRRFRLENRHQFLKSLNKDQFDPTRESYIGLLSLIKGDDADFCTNVAKVSPETYNVFLKSL